MPADTLHPEYIARASDWKLISDLLAGQSRVKAARETYLPRTYKQSDADYADYLLRATLYGATARTHEALIGFMLRKPPEIECGNEKFLADCDRSGTAFIDYIRETASVVSSTGRAVTIVDFNDASQEPYCAFYPETEILNWRTEVVDGKKQTTLLVLRETEPSGDEFSHEFRYIFVVWRLTNGAATRQEYRSSTQTEKTGSPAEGTTTLEGGELITPSRGGKPLPFIPVVWHGSERNTDTINKPPLIDLASVNISHFRTSADLENGRYTAGLPTPYAIGFGEQTDLYLGTREAWTTDDPGASCGFLEFSGGGLTSLENAIKEKQEQMAALGARLIEQRGGTAEAYDTVMLRASGETSALAKIGKSLSESLSRILALAAWWKETGAKEPAELAETNYVAMSSDFSAQTLTPEALTALGNAYQAGNISFETFFYNLKRGEFYPDEWTIEEEQSALENLPPALKAALQPPAPPEQQPAPPAA